MAEIIVLPFPGEFALGGLFDSACFAEGRLAWFETLARTTLSPGEHAVLVVALHEGRPKAALPLVRSRDVLRALTAPYTTRYAPPLPDPAVARELGVRAREYVSAVLRMDGLDTSDPGAAAYLEGLSQTGLTVARYQGFANWYEPVSDFGTWWNARPSRLKTTVRRKLAAARKRDVSFRCLRDGLSEAVGLYQDIYGQSWKNVEPHPDFIATMVRALAPEGLIRIGTMSLGGRPVAAQIWLVCEGRATIFKLAHREDAAELSPGTLLTHHMAENLIREDSLFEIDFGRGDDAYKRDWLSLCRTRTGIIAADWRKAAGLAAIAKDILPARLNSFVKAFGRQSPENPAGSAAAVREDVLSLTRSQRMTPDVGPKRGAGVEP
jgi:CelD/BcsL family acetyltransferase involved in cellulose biosynthesis